MKKFVILSVLLMAVVSCISTHHISESSGLHDDYLKSIPKGVKTIIITKMNTSPDSLFEEIYGVLLQRNHRIGKDDKDRHYIATDGKDIAGMSTSQRMTVVISKLGSEVKATISTQWKGGVDAAIMATSFSGIPISPDWEQADWSSGRPVIAFAESLAVASQILDSKIKFE